MDKSDRYQGEIRQIETLKQNIFEYRLWLESLGERGRKHSFKGLDFQKLFIDDINFSELDLSGSKFIGSDFYKVSFQLTNLSDADFSGCNITCCDLCGSSYKRADLSYTLFTQVKLYGVDFSGANFTGTYIDEQDLKEAGLYGKLKIDNRTYILEVLSFLGDFIESREEERFSEKTHKHKALRAIRTSSELVKQKKIEAAGDALINANIEYAMEALPEIGGEFCKLGTFFPNLKRQLNESKIEL